MATTAAPKTRVERLTARLRENPVVAVLLVASAIVVGVASIVRALLAKGADANARDRQGLRAIDYARRGAATGRDDVVAALAGQSR